MADLKHFQDLYLATLRMKAAGQAGEIARRASEILGRFAERGAPIAGRTTELAFEKGLKGAPYIAAGAVGIKGYQKGKEKLHEYKRRKMIRELQRRQKYGEDEKRAMTPQTKGLLAAAALIPVAGAGAGVLVEGIRRAYYAARKSYDFKNMLEANPSLKRENPKQLRQTFNAIHTLNPQFAAEPLVAGTFVRRAMDAATMEGAPAVDPSTATSLYGSYKGRVSPATIAATSFQKALHPKMLGEALTPAPSEIPSAAAINRELAGESTFTPSITSSGIPPVSEINRELAGESTFTAKP